MKYPRPHESLIVGIVFLAGLLVGGGIAWTSVRPPAEQAASLPQSPSPTRIMQSPTASASPSLEEPSPSSLPSKPTPSARPTAPNVSGFPLSAWGRRLILDVTDLSSEGSDCTLNAYRSWAELQSKSYAIAFESECPVWKSRGLDLYLYHVEVTNRTGKPLSLELSQFALVDSDGRTHTSVRVRAKGVDRSFLAGEQAIEPYSRSEGWIASDATHDFIPRGLVYRDAHQALIVRFRGNPQVVR